MTGYLQMNKQAAKKGPIIQHAAWKEPGFGLQQVINKYYDGAYSTKWREWMDTPALNGKGTSMRIDSIIKKKMVPFAKQRLADCVNDIGDFHVGIEEIEATSINNYIAAPMMNVAQLQLQEVQRINEALRQELAAYRREVARALQLNTCYSTNMNVPHIEYAQPFPVQYPSYPIHEISSVHPPNVAYIHAPEIPQYCPTIGNAEVAQPSYPVDQIPSEHPPNTHIHESEMPQYCPTIGNPEIVDPPSLSPTTSGSSNVTIDSVDHNYNDLDSFNGSCFDNSSWIQPYHNHLNDQVIAPELSLPLPSTLVPL